jgi:hypothetical protein
VTRWAAATLAAVALGGLALVSLARALGWSGSRLSLLVSVVSQWLAAWVLWGLAGHLAIQFDLIARYEPALFAAIAVPAAAWQYRAAVETGRERGRVVFVGAQLLWVVVLAVRNGVVP